MSALTASRLEVTGAPYSPKEGLRIVPILQAGGEGEDPVLGHRGAARILDGHLVPVSGALYHHRVRGVGIKRGSRVQCGCLGKGGVTHPGVYEERWSACWRRRGCRPRRSAEPRWVFKWRSCTPDELALQEVEGVGRVSRRWSGCGVVEDLEALRAHRL